MTVTGPVPTAALAALLKVDSLKLPVPGPHVGAMRGHDQITLSPPPTPRALWQLAQAGQHQLATLLPALDNMLRTDPAPLPLGHLARAVGDAAHWIDTGAGKTPSGSEPWRDTVKVSLHEAADLLGRAEQQVVLNPSATAPLAPDMLWAATQIAGAQRQLGVTVANLSRQSATAGKAPRRLIGDLAGATAVFGNALLLVMFVLGCVLWWAGAGLSGTIISGIAALVWGWRVVVASRGLKLELRR